MAHKKIESLKSKIGLSRSMNDLSHVLPDRSKVSESISDPIPKDSEDAVRHFKKSQRRSSEKSGKRKEKSENKTYDKENYEIANEFLASMSLKSKNSGRHKKESLVSLEDSTKNKETFGTLRKKNKEDKHKKDSLENGVHDTPASVKKKSKENKHKKDSSEDGAKETSGSVRKMSKEVKQKKELSEDGARDKETAASVRKKSKDSGRHLMGSMEEINTFRVSDNGVHDSLPDEEMKESELISDEVDNFVETKHSDELYPSTGFLPPYTFPFYQEHGDAEDILEVNSASMESLDDGPNEVPSLDDIDADPELRLLEQEPDLWVHTVDKEVIEGLTEKQVKKQEYIYELIITEKHHCLMLKVMQKVFAEGMIRELNMQESRIKRIFPCLDELITLHCSFLWRLRQRQRGNKYIEHIGDLLVEQFTGENARGLKDAYGVFCSQHKDAASYYKDMLRTDRRFQAFVSQKSTHPLTKKKGIPECILFVTHRVTKYPLMLEALIKYTKDQVEETALLKKALGLVKEILVNINAQVAEKERELRLLEIYHKIDAKSYAIFNDQKFKKSDFFSRNRKLRFEGSALLVPQKGKPTPIQVVVLSDLVFFLLDNNGKYYFYSPESKQAGVIPLRNVLVRERAGEGSKNFFLVHFKNTAEMIDKNLGGEMFELECTHPKDRRTWLDSIREAIEHCPHESEMGDSSSEYSKLHEEHSEKIRDLIACLQLKDKEVARTCEEKMGVVCELQELLGQDDTPPSPQYRALLDDNNLEPTTARGLQINSLMEALRLVSGACGWGTNLARSVSSVGEHQSDAYVSPSLPKRAETFGGFDNSNKDASGKQGGGKKKKDSRMSLTSTGTTESSEIMESLKNRRPSGSTLAVRTSQDNLSMVSTLSGESASMQQQQQQDVAARLIHALHTSLVLSQHHLTQYDILRSKVVVSGGSVDGRFRHSQKLEELRNIQEQISHERAQWTKEKEAQEKWISDTKEEIKKKQEQLRREEQDIQQQRETLYRKLEALNAQGISLGPTLAVYTSTPPTLTPQDDQHGGSVGVSEGGQVSQGSPHSSPTSSAAPPRPRTDKHRNSSASLASIIKRDSSQSLPTHLISATTQQKGSVATVKQQLPMKLAKVGSSSSSGSSQGSMGGASSPGQDHHRTHPSPGSSGGPQQMLPLKLLQGPSDTKGSRMSVGYQRLASSPPSLQESSAGHSHQRTGSSPATLQNGSPATSPGAVSSTAITTAQGTRATRTNTYPKLPNKPSSPASRADPATSKPSSPASRADPATPEAPQEGATSSARPGQRIKDPDTNQDIIFF